MMNIHVIMIASFWIRQVNVPMMLIIITINAIAEGEILLFMSFRCRLVFTKIAKWISHKQIFFLRWLEIIGQKSVSPSISGG